MPYLQENPNGFNMRRIYIKQFWWWLQSDLTPMRGVGWRLPYSRFPHFEVAKHFSIVNQPLLSHFSFRLVNSRLWMSNVEWRWVSPQVGKTCIVWSFSTELYWPIHWLPNPATFQIVSILVVFPNITLSHNFVLRSQRTPPSLRRCRHLISTTQCSKSKEWLQFSVWAHPGTTFPSIYSSLILCTQAPMSLARWLSHIPSSDLAASLQCRVFDASNETIAEGRGRNVFSSCSAQMNSQLGVSLKCNQWT